MATLTTSWQVVASASTGKSYFTEIKVWQRLLSQSVNENTSTIQTQFMVYATTYAADQNTSYSLNVNGTNSLWGPSYKKFDHDEVLFDVTNTIKHENDGTKSISVSASVSMPYIKYSPSCSATVTLPTIPRASTPKVSGTEAGTSVTITTNRATNAFTHTLYYAFGTIAKTQIAANVGASTTWTIPLDTLKQIPNASSGVGTLFCDTYNGTTKVGSTKVVLTITAPANSGPDLTVNPYSEIGVTDTGINTSTLLASVNDVIQGMCKKRAVCKATTKYGSTLKSIKMEGGTAQTANNSVTSGNSYTLDLENPTAAKVVITATDSRGLTSTKTFSGNYYNYVKPTVNSIDIKRDDATASQAKISNVVITGTFWNTTVGSITNNVTVTLRNITSGVDYATTVTKNGNTWVASPTKAVTGILYDQSYQFTAVVQDSLKNSDTKGYTLGSSRPTLWIGKNTVRVYDNMIANGAVKAAKWDGIFPVGFYIWSDVLIDPGKLYGGTWTRITDTFLWAAKDADVGKTGGASTVTLTTDQMPSHTHTGKYTYDSKFELANAGTASGSAVIGINAVGTGSGHTIKSPATGGGKAHENMPPYKGVYCWKRTA